MTTNFLFSVMNKKWKRDNNGNYYSNETNLEFKPHKNFFNKMKWKISKTSFTCSSCRTKYGKGVACIGNQYYNKTCFKCVNKMNNTVQKDLDELKQFFANMENEYQKNKTKWEKTAILSKLKNG